MLVHPWKQIHPTPSLTLSPEAEAALCARRAALVSQLRRVLTALQPDLADDACLDTLRACVADLSGDAPLEQAARKVLKAIDRTTWRLALSGTAQLEHQLSRRHYQRVGTSELRQAGLEGLHQAAERFDIAQGVRFSTYCRFWIKHAMGEAVGRLEYAARLPSKARRQLHRPAEDLSPRQARALANVRDAVGLDQPIDDADGDLRIATLEGPTDACPESQLVARRDVDRLFDAFHSGRLDDRERHILSKRFGLGDHDPATHSDIGAELGVSGERVRQLQARALGKLRRALA